MTDKEIIQALKSNEKPFGLMSEEMQDTLDKALIRDIQSYSDGSWVPLRLPLIEIDDYESNAYRLRADYQPKPEVIECKVIIDPDAERLCYRRHSHVEEFIWTASSHPNFIGFDNEGMLWGRLYKWTQDGSFHTVIRRDRLDQYEVCDMSEAKVLFQRSDK